MKNREDMPSGLKRSGQKPPRHCRGAATRSAGSQPRKVRERREAESGRKGAVSAKTQNPPPYAGSLRRNSLRPAHVAVSPAMYVGNSLDCTPHRQHRTPPACRYALFDRHHMLRPTVPNNPPLRFSAFSREKCRNPLVSAFF